MSPWHNPKKRGSCGLTGLALPVLFLCSCADDNSPTHQPGSDVGLPDGEVNDASAPSVHDAGHQLAMDSSVQDSGTPPADAELADGASDAQLAQDGAALPPTFLGELVANPPSYLGTVGSSAVCSQSYRTIGHMPQVSAAGHPLFLYFAGTAGWAGDQSTRYDSMAADHVTAAMARRGFVALAVEYDSQLASIFTDKLPCLFGADNSQSLLKVACAMPGVSCELGIATWGHSQGALLAHAAANYDPRVRAVWTTGYSGLTGTTLPFSRFRTVNGEKDSMNGTVVSSNQTAGFSAADQCPDDGRDSCLRPDGSGWIIVRKEGSRNAADHCWFNKSSCAGNEEVLEIYWVDITSNAPFALEQNADWVARTVARP